MGGAGGAESSGRFLSRRVGVLVVEKHFFRRLPPKHGLNVTCLAHASPPQVTTKPSEIGCFVHSRVSKTGKTSGALVSNTNGFAGVGTSLFVNIRPQLGGYIVRAYRVNGRPEVSWDIGPTM